MNRRSLFRSGEPGFSYDPPCYSRWYSRGDVVPVRWPKVGRGGSRTDLAQASACFRQGLEWPLTRANACRMRKVRRYRWPGALNARQLAEFANGRPSYHGKRRANRYAAGEPRLISEGGSSYGPRSVRSTWGLGVGESSGRRGARASHPKRPACLAL